MSIPAVDGIDPDLAWDDGTAIVTFARHPEPIQQVRVDLTTGPAIETPRAVWAGSGGFPESPHLYRRGAWWYLVVAEGGTDRGHAVTVARAPHLTDRSRAVREIRSSLPPAPAGRSRT